MAILDDLTQVQDPQANFGGGIISRLLAQHENKQNANKQAMAAASATERYLKTNAQQFGISPDQIEQQASESPIQYNQRLNSAIQNVMVGQKVKEQNQQMALRQSQMAALASQTAGMDIGNQQQQLALEQQRRQAAYLQSLIGGQGNGMGSQAGQPPPAPSNVPAYLQPNASGQGAPPPPAAMQPPVIQTATAQPQMGAADDTAQKFSQWYANYVRTVHAPPTPEMAQKFIDTQRAVEKPIGMTYAGSQLDGQGNPIGTKWARVMQSNAGTRKVLTPDTILPVGHTPQGVPILDGLGNPISPDSAGQSPAKPGVIAGTTAPTVPNTPERQTAIKDATEHLNMLTTNQAKIQELGQQVAAYIKQNPSTWRNSIMGTDLGLKMRAARGDVTGQKLEQGVANNLNSIMDNMREGGKGSLGMRLTGNEWQQLKEAFPDPRQAPEVQIQGWKNIAVTNQYSRDYAQNYLNNLKTMQPGDAARKANEETPKPDFSKMVLPKPPVIASSGSVAHLKQHPELAQAFDQKFGPGAAAQVLGKK